MRCPLFPQILLHSQNVGNCNLYFISLAFPFSTEPEKELDREGSEWMGETVIGVCPGDRELVSLPESDGSSPAATLQMAGGC